MDKQLAKKAGIRFGIGVLIVMLLVFLPAGTLAYAGGWRFLGVLFLPMLAVGILLLKKNPELLKKRLENKEQQKTQKLVVLLSILMFAAGFVIAGLDFRFDLLQLAPWISHIAAIVFLVGYAMYAEVLRENAYLSRTVKVDAGQKVVDTGLYRIVRHPMYTATILMFTMIPLVLGSVIALPVFLIYPFLIVKRIGNEEAVLEKELDGYQEYKRKVKYRLFPRIW
ncbi:MAG: isoprenylcysteine carboxylmethyltransferase family protein [Oscillospiraceae bacterium]|nr:isoprenylcysteine carboxylmethyltransferase family protein [Oscillospiraceae bacterium]MCR4760307.1 isoprenylcysteine carboxylmethyltransferase family protein [Oscillospiraceae bacterium]